MFRTILRVFLLSFLLVLGNKGEVMATIYSLDFVDKFGSVGTGDGQFYSGGLHDLEVDTNYIYTIMMMQKFDKTSPYAFVEKRSFSYGCGNGQSVGEMYSMAVDDNYIYILERACKHFQIFNKTTPYAHVATVGGQGTGDGQFVSCKNIVVDDSYIYVSEGISGGNGHRIQIFDKASPYAFVASFGEADTMYLGLAVDANYIYATIGPDYGNEMKVGIYDKNSPYTQIATFGSMGSGDGQFSAAWYLAVDDTYIYVSERGNHRIQIFSKASPYTFLIKTGEFGTGDGQFKFPHGLRVDGQYIYVADTSNNRVQIFQFQATEVNIIKSISKGLPFQWDVCNTETEKRYEFKRR